MKVLVIAAHPDDEVLGVGGTILKHTANGDDVYVCIVTKAYEPNWSKEYIKNKLKEAKEVDKILGVKKRIFCNFPTTKLNTISTGEFTEEISNVIENVKPEIVYTHFKDDMNRDHGILFNATLVASRPDMNKKISLMCFETLSSTEWGSVAFKPNVYTDISDYIEEKIEAFLKYQTENKKYPHPRSPAGIKIWAKQRGVEICVEYAEAFILVREVR